MQAVESRISTKSPTVWTFQAAFCAILTFFVVGLTLTTTAQAQDDPFALGNDTEAVDSSLALTDPNSVDNETTALVLRTLQKSQPVTPVAVANAVKITMDLELYGDARFYLEFINRLGLNDQQMFDLNEAIGSDFFSLIQAHEAVQPEGKILGSKVLEAATRVGLDPARIDKLVKTLNNADISVRSEAFRRLRRLGEPAVAELLNVFAQADRKADFPGIRGALQSMGDASQGPLIGAARASNRQVQTEAIRALGNYRTPESLDVLMRASLSPEVPEFIQKIAKDALIGSNNPIDVDSIEERLYQRSREYLIGERQVGGALLGDVTVWTWDASANRMVANNVDPATAARVKAARGAANLYEIQPETQRNRELYLLTQLETAKRLVGPSRKVNVDGLVKSLDTNPDEINHALSVALNLELIPAAIACCELLETIGSEELLKGPVGEQQPLIQALLFGDRHLQFAAMNSIITFDPQEAFAGSSYLLNLAVYLARSENRPAGLIGHNREDLGQTYAATLAASGIMGRAASSSREFYREATADPDMELLMVTDTLGNPEYGNLIQQLRNDWRTRRLPIALLYRDTDRSRRLHARLGDDPLLTLIPFSLEPQYVDTHVSRLVNKIDPWKVTNLDRSRHAAASVRWLEKIATDRKQYDFYDLGGQQDQLIRLLYLPGFADSASLILASLGTATAQRELVNFASQSGLPVEEREKAVEAFARSVNVGGTLLTTDEIQQQYDRYNASKNEAEGNRKVLGSILDAIESRKRSDVAN